MKFVPKSVTRVVAKQALNASQHSPRILFVAGVGGVVVSTVLACKATLRLEGVLTDAELEIASLKAQGPDAVESTSMDYTALDFKKDLALLHVRHLQRVAKLYAPALIVGTLSVAALTKSHSMLNKRNATLSLAYAAAVESYDEYVQRVRNAVGDEKEKEIRYGLEDHTVVEDTDKGPKKFTVKRATQHSMYSRFYDEFAKNWQADPELNRIFIENQERYCNDLLHAKGYVFLNDVYRRLGLDETEAGQHVGWTMDGTGDGFISFGMYDGKNKEAFINGYEASILLDFNVDGPIVKKAFQR